MHVSIFIFERGIYINPYNIHRIQPRSYQIYNTSSTWSVNSMQAQRRHRYSVCCFLLHAIGHVDSGTVKQKDIKKQPLLITKKHLSNGKNVYCSIFLCWSSGTLFCRIVTCLCRQSFHDLYVCVCLVPLIVQSVMLMYLHS